jgi:TPR repeat protein
VRWRDSGRDIPEGDAARALIAGHDMEDLSNVKQRRQEAALWYAQYRAQALPADMAQAAAVLTDDDITQLVNELR